MLPFFQQVNENPSPAEIADAAEKLSDSAELISRLELTEEQKLKLTGLTGSHKIMMMLLLRMKARMSLNLPELVKEFSK